MTVRKIYRAFIAFALCGCVSITTLAQSSTASPLNILTLETATEQFLKRNLALEAARLEVGIAEAERVAARLRPRPGLTVSAENLPISGPTPANQLRETGLTFTQPFEIGNQRRLRLQLAERTVAVAEAQLASVLSQRLFELKRSFYEAVLAQIVLTLEQENRDNFTELLRLTTARFQEGEVSESELIKVRLERIKFDSTLANATLALRQAKIRLLEILGESEFVRTENAEVRGALTFREVSLDLTQLRQVALTNRADVKVFEAEVARAESALSLERSRGKGEITPYIGYKRVGVDNTLLGGVTVPLPFGNRNQGGIARAAAEKEVAEAHLRLTRNRTLAEVESAYRAYETARDQVRAYESGILKQADESRDITLYAYREGATELITLLDAQRTRAEVRANYYKALLDYYASLFRLEFTTGMEIIK
ncbi:MAG: TolC family protein [Acidobacteriota bacterium]